MQAGSSIKFDSAIWAWLLCRWGSIMPHRNAPPDALILQGCFFWSFMPGEPVSLLKFILNFPYFYGTLFYFWKYLRPMTLYSSSELHFWDSIFIELKSLRLNFLKFLQSFSFWVFLVLRNCLKFLLYLRLMTLYSSSELRFWDSIFIELKFL